MNLKPTRASVPLTCVTSIHEVPNFIRFALRPAVVELQPFWEKCTKWPQNDLERYKVNLLLHTCITSVPDSQISIPFAVRPAVFETQAIWYKFTKWPQTSLEPYKVNLLYTFITSVPNSQISLRLLYDQLFSRHRPFGDKSTEWPQTDLEPYKVKLPYTCITIVSLITKCHSASLYEQPFSRYRPFCDKWTEWPPNDRKHYKVKGTPYMCYSCPGVPNFAPFCSTTTHFRDRGHFETRAPNDPKMTWTLQGQRNPIYMLLVSPSPNVHSVLLYDHPFSKYRTFYNSPLTTKKKKKCH